MHPFQRSLLLLATSALVSCAAPRVDAPATSATPATPTPSTPSANTARTSEPALPADAQPRLRGMRGDTDACPPQFSGSCYPVWFGTNRKPLVAGDPSRGFGSEVDERIHYGKRIVRIPASHRVGELGSPLWRRLLTQVDDRITVDPATVLAEDAFAREVRGFLQGLDPADRNVLVYIHGFNTSFDEAARRAAQLGFDLKVPGITAFFSWPSRGNLSAYLTDLSAVEASEDELATFLVKMSTLADAGKVHVIAHSMGNRGLLRALHRSTAQAALQGGVRFGRIFLAAPDVDEKLFRQLAGVYPQISERTTLYVADEDKAFAALAWIADGARVGGAPPVLVLPGIDTVRVRGVGLFELGHSYVAEQVQVLQDIAAQLHWRETPERRRARNGWPVPDDLPGSVGAWVIGR